MIMSLQDSQTTLGERAAEGELRLFDDSTAPVYVNHGRRRAAFEETDDDHIMNNESEDESEEDEDENAFGRELDLDDEQTEEVAYADSDSDLGDEAGPAPWKSNLAKQAEETVLANRRRRRDLMHLIYETDQSPEDITSGAEITPKTEQVSQSEEDFFHVVSLSLIHI